MRILICLLALAVTLTCCKSNKRMIRSEVGYVSTQPVEVAVQEKVQDTLIVEEEPVTVKKEKVGLTDGADLMRYCIIVGSFIYRQNAINLRSDLMRRGFWVVRLCRIVKGCTALVRFVTILTPMLPGSLSVSVDNIRSFGMHGSWRSKRTSLRASNRGG